MLSKTTKTMSPFNTIKNIDNDECVYPYASRHDYVFLVYKDTKYRVGSNIYGIFKTMSEAENLQKKLAREEIQKDGDAIYISQIPLNSCIPSHTDYVMKVIF